jgi:D-tyrosyl-tRNA(Tyr) deacylase
VRAVVQRVKRASVSWPEGRSEIGPGLLILLGVHPDDDDDDARWLADKCVDLRIFNDEQGKMNHSVLDRAGEILVVSQFTLYGDCRKGRRPSYVGAAAPEIAEPLVERFVHWIRNRDISVRTGSFGAAMEVSLVNDGPVTLIADTP